MPEAVRSSELALEPPVVPVSDIPAIEEPTASAPPVAASAAPVAEELEPIGPEDEAPSSALGRATSRNTQSIKTLKCNECGSMNYPTEWYCERCGGELAAL